LPSGRLNNSIAQLGTTSRPSCDPAPSLPPPPSLHHLVLTRLTERILVVHGGRRGRGGVDDGCGRCRWRREGRGGPEQEAVQRGADQVARVHVRHADQAGAAPEAAAGARARTAAPPGRHLVPEQARALEVQAARARVLGATRRLRRAALQLRVAQEGEARAPQAGTYSVTIMLLLIDFLVSHPRLHHNERIE
jgi:hypothetical protein